MQESYQITPETDLTPYSMDRLKKELTGIQNALDMLYTMNNSLEDTDLSHGGGSEPDQAEYQRLSGSQKAIVAEINKRHMLAQIN
jgi:hypothetical protein